MILGSFTFTTQVFSSDIADQIRLALQFSCMSGIQTLDRENVGTSGEQHGNLSSSESGNYRLS